VLLTLTTACLDKAFEKPPSVGRGPQQVCGLLQRFVVRTGDQDRIAPARRDLHGRAVVVDLLDEREKVLAGFGRAPNLLAKCY
jgi:hypothetical protein